jgi:hypothetical protein
LERREREKEGMCVYGVWRRNGMNGSAPHERDKEERERERG